MQGDWRGFVKELRRDSGWRVVLASGIGFGLGLNVLPYYTLGAFMGPLKDAFGWSRGEVQAALIFLVLATLAGAWGTGWLTDRHGVRKVALCAQIGLAIGLAMLGMMPGSLRYWYAVWFFMSLVALGSGPITWTRAIAGWFDAGRGFALAMALCCSGIFALVGPTSVVWLIELWGWRVAYLVLSGVVLAIAIPATIWILPARSQRPAPERSGVEAPTGLPGLSVAEALKTYRFWALMTSTVLLGFAMSGMIPNLMPMVIDRGVAPAVAASLLGVLGMSLIVGRLAAGFALDRMWAPAVAAVLLPLPALSSLLLAYGVTDYLALAGAVMLFGLATGAEFDLIPYMVTRYFGLKRYSQIYALQWVGWTATAGVAPAVFGYTFDLTGSYQLVLYAAAACFALSPLLILTLGRYRFAASPPS